MDLTFNKYVEDSAQTAIYPTKFAIIYPALGLAGEAGEVANKIKKLLRDYDHDLNMVPEEMIEEICFELGDVLWYIAALVRDLDSFDLQTIAEHNMIKLLNRKQRGVLGGSGDKT